MEHLYRLCYFWLMIVAVSGLWPPVACAEDNVSQRVLLLHSYHQGLSWTDAITQAVQTELADHSVELVIEYLDSKRRPLIDVWPPMSHALAQKYPSDYFDAIIVSDNNALQFMNCEREKIFPEVPLVFCGINHFQPKMIHFLQPRVTGVTEEISALETARLMQHLQPDLKRLIVVSGVTETAAINELNCRYQLHQIESQLTLEWWHGLESNVLFERLAQLNPRQDGVLLLSYSRDASDRYFSFEEQGRLLSTASTAPVYGLWDFYLGTGIMGGAVASGQDQGVLAATLCLRLLQGHAADDLPVQRHTSGNLLVDQRVLNRFQISDHRLPDEATVLFQKHSFYRQHTREFWLAVTIFMLLSLLSLRLVASKKRLARIARDVRESQKRFTDVTNSLNDVLILLDPQLRVQLMNEAGMRAYHVDPDNYQGQLCHELFWNSSIPCENCPSLQVMKDGNVAKAFRFRDHGQVLDRSIYPVYGDAEQLIGTAVIASDITERYHAEQALRRSQEQLRDVANSMPGAIFQFSVPAFGQKKMNYVGGGIRSLAGLDKSVDIMQPSLLLEAIVANDRRRVMQSSLRAARQETIWDDEFRFATPQGEKWVHGRAYPRKEDDGSIIFNGVLTDISGRKVIEAELEHRVNHDHLTGLANALLYRDRLEHALVRTRRHGEMLAVVMLDLDRFKEINDSLGHAAGDDLLQQVSRRLQDHLRGDDTVARLGGDEFMVLLEGLRDPDSLVSVLEKMMQTFTQPFWVEGQELRIASSVGVTTFPEGGDSVESLIKNADVAMYKAKKNGGGHYYFYAEELTELALERLTLERDLRKALEQNELLLHYQPKVDLVSGELISLETLLRWPHPQRGMVPPDIFIPLAEASELILPLGEWVLKEACRQACRWREQDLYFGRVAVNISPVQIKRGRLLETVKNVLHETGVEPASLCLEITETSLMEINDQILRDLHTLREWGISLAVDDFGTGYSSLTYLKRLPINTLKLDKSFVDDLPHSDESAAIAQAVIAMAHALQLKVVAEGVENEDQRQFLLNAGADRGQGYLWARPQAQPDFSAFPKKSHLTFTWSPLR
ncbi:MAG: EAL domain-containing protein [Desulfuromonas sp.]|nr:EAL domain-containing protein [Desulfuromonas sp.]